MNMLRDPKDIANLKVEHFMFKKVKDFKSLGVNVYHRNNMHSEVRQRNNAANRAYFVTNNMLNVNLLWKTNKKLFICYISSIVMYI